METEHNQALSTRQPLEAQWRRWLEQYRATAVQPQKNFPYPGAPNYQLPVTATDVDQLIANFMTTIHAPDNLWTIGALNERWLKAAKPAQDYLEWLDHAILHMWRVNRRVIPEMVKLGTAIYKTGWDYSRRKVTVYDQRGNASKVWKTKGAPFVDHVRLNDFVIPPYSYAIQPDEQGGAPWVEERISKPQGWLQMIADTSDPLLPIMDPDGVKQVLATRRGVQTEYDAKVQEMDYLHRSNQGGDFEKSSDSSGGTLAYPSTDFIELFEIHARFQNEGDEFNDIVVLYHYPSRSILRATYSQYDHGERPFNEIRYFGTEGFYGIGVCEQNEVFQKIQSDVWNYQLINSELGNAKVIFAKAGSSIGPGEPWYPGAVKITDGNPKDEVAVFSMGDMNSSLPQIHGMAEQMRQRRSGIGDIQLGQMQSLPGRTPATTMLSLMQEGNKRPDLTIKDLRYSGLSKVGLRMLQLSQQYMRSPVDVGGQTLLRLTVQMLGMPEGMELAQKLLMPMEDAALGLGVAITATSGSANKEVAKQNQVGLLQLAAQLYPQFIQIMQFSMQAMQMGPAGEPVAKIGLDSMRGLAELFTRTLEQADVRNPEIIVPAIPAMAPQEGQAGGPAGAAQNGNGGGDPMGGGAPLALMGGGASPFG